MKQIAFVVLNMIQYYSALPLMNICKEKGFDYNLIIPHFGDSDTALGWGNLENDLESFLVQEKIDYIKGHTQNEYLVCLSTYPTEWEPKAHFKIKYSYGYSGVKSTYSLNPTHMLPYDVILCLGKEEADYCSVFARTCIVGELKMLSYHRKTGKNDKLVLLYLPTYSETASIQQVAPQLKKLEDKYEILIKAHHGTTALKGEAANREILRNSFSKIYDEKTPLYDLLGQADVVLSDNSGAIYDALVAGVPVARFSQVTPEMLGGFIPPYLQLCKEGVIPSTNSPKKLESVIEQALDESVRQAQRKAAEKLYADPEKGKENFAALMNELMHIEDHPRRFSLQRKKNEFIAQQNAHMWQLQSAQEQAQNLLQSTQDQVNQLSEKLRAREYELNQIVNSRFYLFASKYIRPPMHICYKVASKLWRMTKALCTLRFGDFAQEISRPIRRRTIKISSIMQLNKKMAEIRKSISGKRVIIFPPTIDWHMRLFQRPQQLALAYAKKENTVVIYLTKNIDADHVAVTEHISENLYVVSSVYAKNLAELLPAAKETIASISWTVNYEYYDLLKPDKLIYEYIDELKIFYLYDSKMVEDHQNLLRLADVTVCTATKLYNQAVRQAKNPLLSPNAGDYEFFSKTAQTPVSPLISEKIKNYKCVLGYYGALATWFDYELVKEVAQRRPDWLFILLGMNYDGTLDKSGIEQFNNIVYIPPQAYRDLPSFLTAFDIATIPFVINEITLSTSPVKLFEYMAGGKPVLTSKMPECLKYESVRTYADADEFCKIVEEYMEMKPEDPYWKALKREALENTWDARTDQILKEVEKI